MNRISKRKYPEISRHDEVKVYKKKNKFDKEFKSFWLPDVYKVSKTTSSFGQKYEHINEFNKPLLRHELLKV